MYKIGIDCHNLENKRWGIGRHLSSLLAVLAQRSAELSKEFSFFLYFKEEIPPDLYLNNPIFHKKILKIPRLPPSFNLFFHLLLPLAYRRYRLQAMFFPSFMLPAFFAGRSLVVMTNDVYYEYTKGNLPWRYKISYRLFSNWAARRATGLTTYTRHAKNELVKIFRIKPEKIRVNELGINRLRPSWAFKSSLSPASDFLLYVGQAFPRRRVKETILAFEQLSPQLPRLKLIIVGYDKYRPPVLKTLIAETNKKLGAEKIIYYEYLEKEEDLIKLYQEAKLFIYMSTAEAFGLPPLEALGYGTPALVKDDPVNEEIYGKYVFRVKDETNPALIASAIAEALADRKKQKEIIEHAPSILAKFSWEKHADRFLEHLKAICQN